MIKYYDRKNKKYNIEKVAGDKYLKWTYTSPVGMRFLEGFIKKKCFSKLYGKYCDSSISKNKISKFIKDFNINMDEYYPYEYKNFNEFFTRHIKPSSRPIDKNINSLISPCDGKLLAYENIDIHDTKTIKGINYKLTDLINDTSLIKEYNGGACLIFRLCPTDYHRFHFIDNGICHETKKISGHYYSVNPLALDNVKNIFCENKREFSIFHSDNFDNILYIEVGATCVGSIIQTYIPGKYYKKGTEKGYFKFGGSTVILLFKKDIVKIDEDILSQTNIGYECSVLLGETIGEKTL